MRPARPPYTRLTVRLMADPGGYREPVVAYLVEESDSDGRVAQIGGFASLADAERLQARLHSEGRQTVIDVVPIHQSCEDYEHDR
jgi:hypothetical protein